jgi:LysR family hydrogen peroxide-inducible transcriptional activator
MGILAGPILSTTIQTQILYNETIAIYAPQVSTNTLTIEELENLKPWLLSQGNCLRTQMMNFCNLNSSQNDDDWSYAGGSLSILLQMVDQQGGYTLVPENYISLLNLNSKAIKPINGHQPARQIISIENHRNTKKQYLEVIKRTIQHEMNLNNDLANGNITLLPWR